MLSAHSEPSRAKTTNDEMSGSCNRGEGHDDFLQGSSKFMYLVSDQTVVCRHSHVYKIMQIWYLF